MFLCVFFSAERSGTMPSDITNCHSQHVARGLAALLRPMADATETLLRLLARQPPEAPAAAPTAARCASAALRPPLVPATAQHAAGAAR